MFSCLLAMLYLRTFPNLQGLQDALFEMLSTLMLKVSQDYRRLCFSSILMVLIFLSLFFYI